VKDKGCGRKPKRFGVSAERSAFYRYPTATRGLHGAPFPPGRERSDVGSGRRMMLWRPWQLHVHAESASDVDVDASPRPRGVHVHARLRRGDWRAAQADTRCPSPPHRSAWTEKLANCLPRVEATVQSDEPHVEHECTTFSLAMRTSRACRV